MALLDDILRISDAQRLVDLERIESNQLIEGDFEGSVTGRWVKLDPTGAGIVEYKSKNYVTKPIGFTSIPAGAAVELSFAKGVYYSKW
jgi:hypothetical protein